MNKTLHVLVCITLAPCTMYSAPNIHAHDATTKSLVSDLHATITQTQQALVNLPSDLYNLLPSYKQVLPYAALIGAAGIALKQGVVMWGEGWRMLAANAATKKGKEQRRKGFWYLTGSATLLGGGLLTLKYAAPIVTALNKKSD